MDSGGRFSSLRWPSLLLVSMSREADADPDEFTLGQEFVLGGGQEAVFSGNDLSVRFSELLEDSGARPRSSASGRGRRASPSSSANRTSLYDSVFQHQPRSRRECADRHVPATTPSSCSSSNRTRAHLTIRSPSRTTGRRCSWVAKPCGHGERGGEHVEIVGRDVDVRRHPQRRAGHLEGRPFDTRVGGDDAVLVDQPGPHLRRVDAVGRVQRGDGAGFVDRFDDPPSRHVGERGRGSCAPTSARRARTRSGPAATCSPSATERPTWAATLASPCASRSRPERQVLLREAAGPRWPARVGAEHPDTARTRGPLPRGRVDGVGTDARAVEVGERLRGVDDQRDAEAERHIAASSVAGCTVPRWLPSAVRCTSAGGFASR